VANEARCSQLLAGFIPLAASVGYCACVLGVLVRSSKFSNGLPATFEGLVPLGSLFRHPVPACQVLVARAGLSSPFQATTGALVTARRLSGPLLTLLVVSFFLLSRRQMR
jgi:hypothetical protein